MKIEKVNDNQIRCTLTREDLEDRHIKISELAYGSAKAKSLFKDMVEQANYEFGFETNDIPLMVEAIPLPSESIVLIITKVEYPDELDTRFSKFSEADDDFTDLGNAGQPPVIKGAADILELFERIKKENEKTADSEQSTDDITEEQAAIMSDKEVIDLLFKPSFSTSDKVTDVSGRGVGLDVVKSKIEALGGDVEVKSVYGEGSTFIIRLPLTLAIIQALMVKLGDEKYAISLGSIQTIEDIPVSEIKYVHAKEVIHLRGNVIPLIRLRELLDVPGEQEEQENITVVIVSKGDKQAGLVVDSLIGQMEIVIKSLGKYININKMISGATILGDGSVALIIDANTLV